MVTLAGVGNLIDGVSVTFGFPPSSHKASPGVQRCPGPGEANKPSCGSVSKGDPAGSVTEVPVPHKGYGDNRKEGTRPP